MTEGQQKITVALCAGIVAKTALEFTDYYPEMREMLKRNLLQRVQLLIDAVDGKDVARRQP
jgi:hypothetical protein